MFYDKNANQAHVCESPKVELCKSVVLEQTATPVEDNRNNNSTSLIVTLGVDETLSEDIRNNSNTSVIPPLGVVESVPVVNYDKILTNEDTSSLLNTQSPTNIDGEFKGVDRRRNKIKHFFLSGISEDIHENQIMSYLNKRNITPTRISVFKSRRKGSNSAKVSIPSSATPWLFLVMINDLSIVESPSKNMWKFADDNTISEVILKDEESTLQETMNQVADWSKENKFQLNPKKCKELRINFTSNPIVMNLCL